MPTQFNVPASNNNGITPTGNDKEGCEDPRVIIIPFNFQIIADGPEFEFAKGLLAFYDFDLSYATQGFPSPQIDVFQGMTAIIRGFYDSHGFNVDNIGQFYFKVIFNNGFEYTFVNSNSETVPVYVTNPLQFRLEIYAQENVSMDPGTTITADCKFMFTNFAVRPWSGAVVYINPGE